jgi:glycosyltransferase involved in cell wall biosynthesis
VHHWSTLHAALVRDARAAGVPVVVTLHDLFTTCPRFFRLPPDPSVACPPRGAREACVRCVAPDAPGLGPDTLRTGFAARDAWVAGELAAASALVVPSRAQAEHLGEHLTLDPARLHLVPHGLSDPLPRVVTRDWDSTGPLRVLFLGHRSDVKGVRELVQGAAGLGAAARARIELVLLGDALAAGYDDELRHAARDVRLVFAGNYAHAELAARVAALLPLHLGAFPSRAWESYGLVPDELWALGLPVWLGDRGAPKERVLGAGRVLPAGDAAAWTRALSEVLADPSALEGERSALPARARTAADAARELDSLYVRLRT